MRAMTCDAVAPRGSDQRTFFRGSINMLEAPVVSTRFQLLVEELVAAHQQEVEELQSALGKRIAPSSAPSSRAVLSPPLEEVLGEEEALREEVEKGAIYTTADLSPYITASKMSFISQGVPLRLYTIHINHYI